MNKTIGLLLIQLTGNIVFVLASAANPYQPLINIWSPQMFFNLAIVKNMP